MSDLLTNGQWRCGGAGSYTSAGQELGEEVQLDRDQLYVRDSVFMCICINSLLR
jgi:hypothetical protein